MIYVSSLIRDVYETKLLVTGMGSILIFVSCRPKELVQIGCSPWPRLVPCNRSRKGCHMVRVLVRVASRAGKWASLRSEQIAEKYRVQRLRILWEKNTGPFMRIFDPPLRKDRCELRFEFGLALPL